MGSQLEVVQTAKDLSVVITNDLKWSDHISAVVAKANRMLGFMKRNYTGDLNKDALKLTALCIVGPIKSGLRFSTLGPSICNPDD